MVGRGGGGARARAGRSWDRGVVGRLSAVQLHGIKRPSGDRPELPSLVAARCVCMHSALWPDRSISMPVTGYRPVSSILTVIARQLPLPGSDIQPSIILTIGDVRIVLFCDSDHGVPANVAYAHHDSNRNVPDEWV